MEVLKLSAAEIRYIALFESMTGAVTKDCVMDKAENKIVFVVKKGDMGLAIGKKGGNIQRVKQALGKKIEVIEYSNDAAEFVKNIFHPIRIKHVSVTNKRDKKVALVEVDDRDRALAIGRKGKNIQKVKLLAGRHHKVEDVVIT
jgi:N utilization substance protein A